MRTELSLSGTWELAGFDPGKGGWARARRPYPIAAKVPGEVHPALVAAGVIEDPYFGTNVDQVAWVEQKEWWYRRTFTPAPGARRTRAFLEFDGLDTFGEIFLNGEKLGSVASMFISHRFDVTSVLVEGENTLEVRFQPVLKALEGLDLSGLTVRYNPVRVGARKMQASFMGQDDSREMKQEVTGVVVDPSGLVVTSLAGTNIAGALASSVMDGDSSNSPKVSSNITSVKILLTDGKELPGKVVLRDKDLDLAFIRPATKPADPLPALDLAKTSSPGILDPVVIVRRQGSVANRSLDVTLDRIHSVVEKPRTFYVPTSTGLIPSLGSPVFSMDGSVVGLMLLRMLPKSSSSAWLETGSAGLPGVLPIILPASEIAAAAKQAPEKEEVQEGPAPAPAAKPQLKKPSPAPKPSKPGTK